VKRLRIGENMRILLSFTLIFFLLGGCFAQSDDKLKKNCDGILLDTRKPSAFITFERFEKRQTNADGESDKGILLRFHNNSRWNIYLKTYGADNENDQYKVSYEVLRIPGLELENKDLELPIGTRITNNAKIRVVKSGKTILFDIPKQHLTKGFSIQVLFSYEWEISGRSGGDYSIMHRASFWSTELPDEK
jgi:hypothetical protein